MERGRPTIRTDELDAQILARTENGESLITICRDPEMPARSTVYEWIESDPDFSGRLSKAREKGLDVIAHSCLEIADMPQLGTVETIKADGSREVRQEDMLGHRKLRIETRLKLLAKWDPKRYGDKLQQEVTGENGGPIKEVVRVVVDPRKE